MPEVRNSSPNPTLAEATNWKWLKAMYVANIFVSLPLGISVVLAPDLMRKLLGIPPGDPIHFGVAAGAVPFAFGVVGILGLRFPLTLSPILALQALYKSLFLIGVALPLLAMGKFPEFALPLFLIYVLFILGNVIAVPFSYLFSRRLETREEGSSP